MTDPSHVAPEWMITIGKSLVPHCRADSRCMVNAVAVALLSRISGDARAQVETEDLTDGFDVAFAGYTDFQNVREIEAMMRNDNDAVSN